MVKLKPFPAGNRRAITVESKLVLGGADKNPTSAMMGFYDPAILDTTVGTVASASAGTLADSTLAGISDPTGIPLEVTCGTTDYTELTEVTGFSGTTLSFGTLSFTPVAGDNYRILGEPVLAEAAATVSGNETSRIGTPADVGRRPRLLRGRLVATFSADDIQSTPLELEVVASSGTE